MKADENTMNVPFVDLKSQHLSIENEVNEAISSVMQRTAFILGPEVSRFEKAFAKYCDAEFAIGVGSGTAALELALRAFDIGPGDEVITAANTFIATALAISSVGAKPVLVDVDAQTYLIDVNEIEKAVTKKTKAIIPVHLYGQPVDMDSVLEVARAHNLIVIEDACQAHMAQWRGKHVGTLGDVGCFSFQNSKNLPCGEGGAIIGTDQRILDKCHSFGNCGRAYGSVKGRGYAILGTNRRMAEYQAAILLGQMKGIEDNARRRTANAEYLTSQIEGIPGISPQKEYPETTRSAYHLYAFRYFADQFGGVSRSKFLSAMRREGIPVSSGYTPLNKESVIEDALGSRNFQKAFSKSRLEQYRRENVCPANDTLCTQAVWLPQSVLLGTKADMDDIAEAVRKVYANRARLI